MLETKRPAIGLDSDKIEFFVGKKANKFMNSDYPIQINDVD